ncbi:MAG: serine/threonine protein kinase [Candidatus Wallbacteria bacterium]|nr:serine/threonine protein kinase [Candidatus Wallbacteria bacterium]
MTGLADEDDLPTDLPEEFLARYTLHRLLGAGAMGRVYEATQHSLKRRVAVKIVRADAFRDLETARRFQEEARILARLAHPNIVRLFDAGLAGQVPYLTTEFVEGVTWNVHLGARQLEPAEAALLAAQLLDGLEYLHANGVVHRDLKPENIFILEGRRVKLIDFGLAKHLEHGLRLTQEGFAVGTPAFMAPEQIMGEEVSPAWDVYAAGVILFRSLTGLFPFPTATTQQLMEAKLERDPERLETFLPAAPSWLSMAVNGSLAADPAKRLATVSALRAALQPGFRGLDSSLVRSPSSSLRVARAAPATVTRDLAQVPVRRTGMHAVLLGLAVAGAGLFWHSASGHRPAPAPVPAAEPAAAPPASPLATAEKTLSDFKRELRASGIDDVRESIFHPADRSTTGEQKAARIESCLAKFGYRERLAGLSRLVHTSEFADRVSLAVTQPFYDALKDLRRTDLFCQVLGVPWRSGVESLETARWKMTRETSLVPGPGQKVVELEVPLSGGQDFQAKVSRGWAFFDKDPVYNRSYRVQVNALPASEAAEVVLCSRNLVPGSAFEVWVIGQSANGDLWFHNAPDGFREGQLQCIHHAFDSRILQTGSVTLKVKFVAPVPDVKQMKSRLDRLAIRMLR